MVRKNKSTRRSRKQHGGFLGLFGGLFGKKTDGQEVPTEPNTRTLWEKITGKSKNSGTAIPTTSLVPAPSAPTNASAAAPVTAVTAPAAGGGRRRKATRKSRKSRKSKTSRKH